MRITVNDTELYFDVEGAGLVPDGATMRGRPVLLAGLSHLVYSIRILRVRRQRVVEQRRLRALVKTLHFHHEGLRHNTRAQPKSFIA